METFSTYIVGEITPKPPFEGKFGKLYPFDVILHSGGRSKEVTLNTTKSSLGVTTGQKIVGEWHGEKFKPNWPATKEANGGFRPGSSTSSNDQVSGSYESAGKQESIQRQNALTNAVGFTATLVAAKMELWKGSSGEKNAQLEASVEALLTPESVIAIAQKFEEYNQGNVPKITKATAQEVFETPSDDGWDEPPF